MGDTSLLAAKNRRRPLKGADLKLKNKLPDMRGGEGLTMHCQETAALSFIISAASSTIDSAWHSGAGKSEGNSKTKKGLQRIML